MKDPEEEKSSGTPKEKLRQNVGFLWDIFQAVKSVWGSLGMQRD